MILQPVIISAPFGNYYNRLDYKHVTHTLGTYTALERNSSIEPYGSKWWRVAKTVRYSFCLKGWRNKIGLKNPGIDSFLKYSLENPDDVCMWKRILSVYGFNRSEWDKIFDALINHPNKPMAIEINASCPNVNKLPFQKSVFHDAVSTGIPVIVKLSPVFFQPIVDMAVEAGISTFHACNTLPTPLGGMSGKPLIKISQGVVSHLRSQLYDAYIIGGGGITCVDDAIEYSKCGADSVALGTMLFNVLNWRKIRKIANGMRSIKLDILDNLLDESGFSEYE